MANHEHKTRHIPRSACPAPRLVVPKLLAWFAANARDLPWRRTRNPYAIWVSEIMLQQTQVKTVIPYWERWMRELPTLEALAAAAPEKIHKLWEGLGYYTRVRNMQKAAQQILKSGKRKAESRNSVCLFPETFEEILALPGIGRYTAGAIASIAFNQPAPILDGNVIRVLTRLHGMGEDPREKKTNARLWELAEELVAHAKETEHATRNTKEGIKSKITIKNPAALPCSALNQSLMELGALVCTPRSPNCAACPVARHCFAHRKNRVEEFPRPKQRAAVTQRRFIVMIIEREGKFLVRQRPAGEVNAHLWEFPSVEVGARLSPAAAGSAERCNDESLASIAAGLLRLGQPRSAAKPLCTVKHSITRYRIITEAWLMAVDGKPAKVAGTWRTLAQLHQLAFTSAHRRILARLAAD